MPAGRTFNVTLAFEADLNLHPHSSPRLMALIAREALFLDPRIVRGRGPVFPRTARNVRGRQRPGDVVGGIRYFRNEPPKFAFFAALGSSAAAFANFTVCHLYAGSVRDPAHYTRLANLAVLPQSLGGLADWPRVMAALQRRSYELYGYRGPSGKAPRTPPGYPRRWRPPDVRPDPQVVRSRLDRLTRERPMYQAPRGARGEEPSVKRTDARDLDSEIWARIGRPDLHLLRDLVVRNAYFAPPAVVARVPNPFPRCRRARVSAGERPGETVRGVMLAPATAASEAMAAAIGVRVNGLRGGNTDHAWPEAPRRVGHFCHLGGLVLVPSPLASIVDAPPMRALLQRRLFERTGYRGPGAREPPPSPLMPRAWPETVHLGAERVKRAIALLEKWRSERPKYYRRA